MKAVFSPSSPSSSVVTTGGALRLVAGALPPLAPGQRWVVQVQHRDRDLVTLSDGKRTITVEGLPPLFRDGARVVLSHGRDGTLRWSFPAEKQQGAAGAPPEFGVLRKDKDALRISGKPGSMVELLEKTTFSDEDERRALVKGRMALAAMDGGTRLRGEIVARRGEGAVLLRMSRFEQASGRESYRGASPLLLASRVIPDGKPGDRIQAVLQFDRGGRPSLFVSLDQGQEGVSHASLGRASADSEGLPGVISRLSVRPGEELLALVTGRDDKRGVLRLNVRGVSLEVPAPSRDTGIRVAAGDGLLLRAVARRAGASSETAGPPALEVHRRVPAITDHLQRVLRQNLTNRPPPIGESVARAHPRLFDNLLPGSETGKRDAALTPLDAWMRRATHNDQQPVTGARLAALIRDSGQFLERNILNVIRGNGSVPLTTEFLERDLKVALARLQGGQGQRAPSPGDVAVLSGKEPFPTDSGGEQGVAASRVVGGQSVAASRQSEAAGQGVQRIESGQIHALLSVLRNESMVRFEFPMVAYQQLVTVQMAVLREDDGHLPHQEGGGERPLHVLIALELSALGVIRVDARIHPSTVTARVHLDDGDAARFLGRHMTRLTERLRALGFSSVSLSTTHAEPDPEISRRFLELVTMVPETSGLLDVSV